MGRPSQLASWLAAGVLSPMSAALPRHCKGGKRNGAPRDRSSTCGLDEMCDVTGLGPQAHAAAA